MHFIASINLSSALVARGLKLVSLVFAPRVLLLDLLFFLRREIIYDVEGLSDFLRGFSFDHIGNSLTAHFKQPADVEEISGQNDFEQSTLVDLEEFLVPRRNVVCALFSVLVIFRQRWVVFVMFQPLQHLQNKLLIPKCLTNTDMFVYFETPQ